MKGEQKARKALPPFILHPSAFILSRGSVSAYNASVTALRRASGANWVRPDSLKRKWRAVVGQLATLKADQISSIAEDSYALAA